MTLLFSLCLPRDRASVPVVRHMIRSSLSRLGVEQECLDDMEVAVTEACSNVLLHAQGNEDEYEVTVEINDALCEIRVSDKGGGFDQSSLEESHPGAESGRGIQLMRALVDNVHFLSRPEAGTIVHLVKNLELTEGSILRQLARAAS